MYCNTSAGVTKYACHKAQLLYTLALGNNSSILINKGTATHLKSTATDCIHLHTAHFFILHVFK